MMSLRSVLRIRPQKLPGWLNRQRMTMATDQLQDHEEFFRFTSGRWLWEEQARLEERYRRFNVAALQEMAASAVGAGRCVSMNKLAEGGFNKIFRLVMDNETVVIARIPTQNAGPLSHTVASEVATMDFASTILGIPVPKVLSWNAKADNPVQSEYILMEEASGVQLENTWNSMDTDSKAEIVEQLVSIANKLLSVSFSCYGSIYFSANEFPGCELAVVDGSCGEDMKAKVKSRYVIGPVVESSFWDGERARFLAVHGPWSKPEDYLKAIATREITWLSKYAAFQEKTSRPFQSLGQKSPEQHITLYRKLLAASDHLLPTDSQLVRSTLWHWDLHAPNIFVTGNKITGIIDWQDCWAGPLILQAPRPQIVDFQGDIVLKLPPQYESLEEGPEKRKIRYNVEKSVLLFSYESQIQRLHPVLDELFHLSQGTTIRDTVLFAANTWDGSIVPFRQCLIRIFRHWKEICPTEECPFTFTRDELDSNITEGERWNENTEFWSSLSGFVARDGFVLKEDYDEAFEMFAKLREDGLEMFEGDERAEFDRATTWAVKEKQSQSC